MDKVVAPPYDVISPKMQGTLYKKHANNIVRIDFGRVKSTDNEIDNRYKRAKSFFESWLNENILIEDKDPAIYIYSQKYKYGGKSIERVGFMGLMKLELGDGKTVLPHENTLKAPKIDRLDLMRSVPANLSPVFMLYEDDRHAISGMLKNFSKRTKPFIDIGIDNVRHKVWKLTEADAIEKIEKFMLKKDIFIADGHHRYETAVNYANEIEKSSSPQELKDNSKYLMAYFCEIDDKTLSILPTHRLIKDVRGLDKENILKKLDRFFIMQKAPSIKKLLTGLSASRNAHTFGMYLGKNLFYIIRLKKDNMAEDYMGKKSRDWKNLDVAILHLFIIQNVLALCDEDDNIEFIKSAEEAANLVKKGKYKIAFFLNPTLVTQVKKVAQAGEKMPRKATYFYPKPISGLVINKF